MKKYLLIIICIFLCLATVIAGNTLPVNLLKTENITVSAEAIELFELVHYDADCETFEFTTNETISFIQIFNAEGQLEFQLPVMSHKVKIGKSIFGEGVYNIGFMVNGKKEIQMTQLTISL